MKKYFSTPKPIPVVETLSTEAPNPKTENIDRMDTAKAVDLFISEDRIAFEAVKKAAPEIVRAVDFIVEAFRKGGRLVYIGAGSSGRLAFLDAAECPPTFGVSPEMVVPLMAGGDEALKKAVEGAEDDCVAAISDLKRINFRAPDILVGITASGTTPFVRAGLDYSVTNRCRTILIACNPVHDARGIDAVIIPLVGPEAISGSTRLKSGTACKMILNMLSTLSMIQIGKVYKNLMVDLVATNQKLKRRARRIVCLAGETTEETSDTLLERTGGEVKTAIFLAKKGGSVEDARLILSRHRGNLAKALGEVI